MFHLSKILSLAVFITLSLAFPYSAHSQQANEPKYHEGDWWRIKTELEVKDPSRHEGCQDAYKEWHVKIDNAGRAHVYGVDGVKQMEASCNLVLGWVFGISDRKSLRFPLSVSQTWTHSYETGSSRRPTKVKPEYKVLAWEKVQTPKGTFDAFKITGTANWITGRGDDRYSNWTEYYSPKVKAIVLYEGDSTFAKRKVALVDFNLATGIPTN
jgi:hypothetical protein